MSLLSTPSQTVGPFLSIGFSALAVDALAAEHSGGERVLIHGRLLDGDGKGASDGNPTGSALFPIQSVGPRCLRISGFCADSAPAGSGV